MAKIVEAKMSSGAWSVHAKGLRTYACLRYANEFHDISHKAGFPIVRTFRLGQAIELYLKAFLFSRGYGETALKKKPFGHNLKQLLNEAISKGLDQQIHISPRVRGDLEVLNAVYASKALQYFSIRYLLASPELPELRRLFRLTVSLKGFWENIFMNQPNCVFEVDW